MIKHIAAVVVALAAASPALAQQEEASIALPAISVNFSPNYIAEDRGFWRDAGINVKLTQLGGIQAMNAMLSGSVEFSNSSVATIIRANIRGQKVLAIGTALDGIMQEIVLGTKHAQAAGVTETSPIEKRAQALKGKKLSVDSPNTLPHAMIRYFARKGGLDPERDITIASMQPEAAIAALKSGAIDGVAGGMPQTVQAVHDGHGILLASGVRGDFPELLPITNNMIVTRPDTCEKRPSACEKLMQGYSKAAAFMHEKPEESVAILKKKMSGMDDAVLRESFTRLLKWTPKSTKINEAVFANSQDFMVAGGMLKAEEKLSSFKDIYSNKFAK
jgi:ABC-type nitrate/sulfonate/bicarbonate transport system substrate-binding protein